MVLVVLIVLMFGKIEFGYFIFSNCSKDEEGRMAKREHVALIFDQNESGGDGEWKGFLIFND